MLAPAITIAVTEVRVSAWPVFASPMPVLVYSTSPASAASTPAAIAASRRMRGTLTPIRFALTGSEPAARKPRPSPVRCTMIQISTASPTATTSTSGMPPIVVPSAVMMSPVAEPPGAERSTCAAPTMAIEVTRVAMTGGSDSRVTSRPLTSPTTSPTASASTTPSSEEARAPAARRTR